MPIMLPATIGPTTLSPILSCSGNDDESKNTWIGLSLACVFVLVGSFLVKRDRYKKDYWSGRPGPLVPLNFIDSYQNRFGFAASFGATAIQVFNLLFNKFSPVFGSSISANIALGAYPGWIVECMKLVSAFGVALLYFPFFVCLKRKNELFFSISGIIFSLIWGILKLLAKIRSVKCIHQTAGLKKIEAFKVVLEIPSQICILALLVMFSWSVVCWFRNYFTNTGIPMGYSDDDSNWRNSHIYHYVKDLLTDRTVVKDYRRTRMKSLLQRIYKWDKGFKYSMRMICTFTVAAFCIYVLGIFFFTMIYTLFDVYLIPLLDSNKFEDSIEEISFGNYTEAIRTYCDVLRVSSYLSVVLTSILTCLSFLNMLSIYRRHILLLRKGDRSWMPDNIQKRKISRSSLVVAGIKFSGYQVAYVCWGFAIILLMMIIILFIFGSQILLPIIEWKSSPLINLIIRYWPTLLFSAIVFYSQQVIVHFFFLLDKSYSFSIDNRNAFNIASYFLFFFNIILGLLSCFLRIIRGVVLGVVFLARLQKCLLPRHFETLDPGYHSYLGFILLEHAHNNPIVVAFMHLMQEDCLGKKQSNQLDQYTISTDHNLDVRGVTPSNQTNTSYSWLKARNRWQLAKTLISNPSLRKFRKTSINNSISEIMSSSTLTLDERSLLI